MDEQQRNELELIINDIKKARDSLEYSQIKLDDFINKYPKQDWIEKEVNLLELKNALESLFVQSEMENLGYELDYFWLENEEDF